MSYQPTQFAASRSMAIYESHHQINMWEDSFKSDSSPNTGGSTIVEANGKLDYRSEEVSHRALGPPRKFDQEANKLSDKVSRRLAQNREAARKSRLRKKAYVQQLESSRTKLLQLEQELERVRQQGLYVGGYAGASNSLALPGTFNSGIATFEMEYGHWVEEQSRQIDELRTALQAQATDIELQLHILVESSMRHYEKLFEIKSNAARSDVFYLMSGMWKTPSERLYLWIGGFRPSEVLKVLTPKIETLTEKQIMDICNLGLSSRQAEDALSQGMEKLQETLAETLASGLLLSSGESNYMGQMMIAVEKLEALINFVTQADHIRYQTLLQIHRILTRRQAARALLALGDYFQRLRALSTIWAARPHERA